MLTFNGTKDLFSDFDPVHVFYRNVVDAYRFFLRGSGGGGSADRLTDKKTTFINGVSL